MSTAGLMVACRLARESEVVVHEFDDEPLRYGRRNRALTLRMWRSVDRLLFHTAIERDRFLGVWPVRSGAHRRSSRTARASSPTRTPIAPRPEPCSACRPTGSCSSRSASSSPTRASIGRSRPSRRVVRHPWVRSSTWSGRFGSTSRRSCSTATSSPPRSARRAGATLHDALPERRGIRPVARRRRRRRPAVPTDLVVGRHGARRAVQPSGHRDPRRRPRRAGTCRHRARRRRRHPRRGDGRGRRRDQLAVSASRRPSPGPTATARPSRPRSGAAPV